MNEERALRAPMDQDGAITETSLRRWYAGYRERMGSLADGPLGAPIGVLLAALDTEREAHAKTQQRLTEALLCDDLPLLEWPPDLRELRHNAEINALHEEHRAALAATTKRALEAESERDIAGTLSKDNQLAGVFIEKDLLGDLEQARTKLGELITAVNAYLATRAGTLGEARTKLRLAVSTARKTEKA